VVLEESEEKKPKDDDFNPEVYRKAISRKRNESVGDAMKRLSDLAVYWDGKDKTRYDIIQGLITEVGEGVDDQLPF